MKTVRYISYFFGLRINLVVACCTENGAKGLHLCYFIIAVLLCKFNVNVGSIRILLLFS